MNAPMSLAIDKIAQDSKEMQQESSSRPAKCLPGGLLPWTLCAIVLASLLTIMLFGSNVSYPKSIFSATSNIFHGGNVVLPRSLRNQISHLQTQMGVLLHQLHNESSESKSLVRFSDQVLHIALSFDKLSNSLSNLYGNITPITNETLSDVDEDFSGPAKDEAEDEEESMPLKVFSSGELRTYTSPKPNRLVGKKNFLGLEALNPSIGLACANMASNVGRYMTYNIHGMCPDDRVLVQKLMTNGCDPCREEDASQEHLHTTLLHFL